MDVRKAAALWLGAALRGHKEAQVDVAELFLSGNGIDKDQSKAFHFFELAADAGSAAAQLRVAEMYADGVGVAANLEKSFRYCFLASEQGLASAHYALSLKYATGNGVEQNNAKAMRHCFFAAEGGHRQAQRNLGHIFENGIEGVKPDLEQAAHYYESAAEQGCTESSERLAKIKLKVK